MNVNEVAGNIGLDQKLPKYYIMGHCLDDFSNEDDKNNE